jgi:acetyl esterase/lipase
MLNQVFPLHVDAADGSERLTSQPDARLCMYILDTDQELYIRKRPLILMCPGGGYAHTSNREAEPLAMRFLAMGYHVAILRYSCIPAVYPVALLELAEAMKIIHAHAKEWCVDSDKIIVQGCSAGAHLAASLGVFWHEKWLADKTGVPGEQLKPTALILCYPVITSGEYAHRGSFDALLAGQCTPELLERVSLENHVTSQTPPVFLWHTFSDESVPLENTLLFAGALRKKEVPFELHIYPEGKHGLSAADELTAYPDGSGIQKECQTWLPLVQTWLKTSICGEKE